VPKDGDETPAMRNFTFRFCEEKGNKLCLGNPDITSGAAGNVFNTKYSFCLRQFV
jgi:hypothetical protein